MFIVLNDLEEGGGIQSLLPREPSPGAGSLGNVILPVLSHFES